MMKGRRPQSELRGRLCKGVGCARPEAELDSKRCETVGHVRFGGGEGGQAGGSRTQEEGLAHE